MTIMVHVKRILNQGKQSTCLIALFALKAFVHFWISNGFAKDQRSKSSVNFKIFGTISKKFVCYFVGRKSHEYGSTMYHISVYSWPPKCWEDFWQNNEAREPMTGLIVFFFFWGGVEASDNTWCRGRTSGESMIFDNPFYDLRLQWLHRDIDDDETFRGSFLLVVVGHCFFLFFWVNDDQEPSVFCAALTCEGRGAHLRQSWISLDGICFCGRYPEKVHSEK